MMSIRDLIGKGLRLTGCHFKAELLHYHMFQAYGMHGFLSRVLGYNSSNDKLIFDIGCSTGIWTRAFLALGANVVAVDPDARAIAHVPDSPHVVKVQSACSDADGEIEYYPSSSLSLGTVSADWLPGARKLFKLYKWSQPEIVSCVRLDSLIAVHGIPYYIKIDVEGHEFEVLYGLTHTPEWISFEASFLTGSGLFCLQRCHDLGYRRFSYIDGGWEFVPDAWLSIRDIAYVISQLPFGRTIDVFTRK